MAVTSTFSSSTHTLTLLGDAASNSLTVSRDAAGKRFGHGRNSFGEQEWVEPSGALLCPRRLKPFPARLSLSAVPNKNGDQRYTPVPKQPRDGQSRPAL